MDKGSRRTRSPPSGASRSPGTAPSSPRRPARRRRGASRSAPCATNKVVIPRERPNIAPTIGGKPRTGQGRRAVRGRVRVAPLPVLLLLLWVRQTLRGVRRPCRRQTRDQEALQTQLRLLLAAPMRDDPAARLVSRPRPSGRLEARRQRALNNRLRIWV